MLKSPKHPLSNERDSPGEATALQLLAELASPEAALQLSSEAGGGKPNRQWRGGETHVFLIEKLFANIPF